MGKIKHGMVGSSEYSSWSNMLTRCYNELHCSYHRYGGRGIRVCDSWRDSFSKFVADMGRKPSPKHQLDRIDNHWHYEPGNCRWATNKENGRNRINIITATIDDETKSVSEWCERLGLNYHTIYMRIHRGMEPEEAIEAPLQKRRPRIIYQNDSA